MRDYPQDGVPRSQPDLINCTVTILSGSKNREIGFLTEWMRAVAFIKSTEAKAWVWEGRRNLCSLCHWGPSVQCIVFIAKYFCCEG